MPRLGLTLIVVFKLNFGMQNIDEIHALEAACSLAADCGVSVKGGNWQIFEQFVKRSGARVFLGTEVSKGLPPVLRRYITHGTLVGGQHRTTLRPRLVCRDTGRASRLRCGDH